MNSENGDSRECWLRPLPFGIFIALALFACFPQVLLGFESFFTRDYGVLAYPNIQFHRDCFWRGELPLWNPYSNCGQPFLAQWGTMTLYPGALLYLLLPLPWSLSVFCFIHVWLAGFGMYWLARRWTDSNFAGALAGTLYVFNGIVFASFVWPNYLVTLGWMPLVVLFAERAWREGGRWLVGATLAATMQMLSGAPEVIIFTWLIVAALWLCDLLRAPSLAFALLRRMIAVVLLTSGLMAVQLLPFFELLKWSHRDAGFATAKWQLPLWGWANFLVPLYNSFETPSGQYYQYDQGFLSSIYLGGIAITFVLVALFRWPDARIWILFILTALAVAMSFGDQTPFFTNARKAIPFVGIARYPVKFLFIVAFTVPLLAGCGLAAIIRSRLRVGAWPSVCLALATMLVIAWAAREHRFVDYSSWPENFRGNVDFSWNTKAPGKWLPDAVMSTAWRIGLFVAATVFLLASLRVKNRGRWLALVSLALVAADVRIHTPDQNPSLPARLFVEPHWTQQPRPELGKSRVMITPEAETFLTFASGTNAHRIWERKRQAEWSNLNLLDRVPKVNGSSTLQIREQRLVEQTLYSMTNRLPAGLLDFLGVAWITSSNASSWSHRTTSLPWLTGGQQPLFLDNAEALAQLTAGSFDPRRVVILSPSAQSGLTSSNAVTATVSPGRITASSVEAEVNAPAPTLVVIAQSFYPPWRATVDGVSAPLLRANVAFHAVPVPAGQHRIRLVYTDSKFQVGAAISAASLLICALAWWRAGRNQRRHA